MAVVERCIVTCTMKMDNFPFDEHNCTIRYLTWMHPNTKCTLANYGDFDMATDANKNQDGYGTFKGKCAAEWNITALSIDVETLDYGVGDWDIASYTISISRRPEYYLSVLLTPMLLITAIVILGLFSPAESTMTRIEKVNLGLTGLLAHAVLLITILESMPKTPYGIPYLGRYMLYQVVMVVVATATSTLLMYIQIFATMGYPVPKFLAYGCMLNFDRLCCGKRSNKIRHYNGTQFDNANSLMDKVRSLRKKIDGNESDNEDAVDGWTLICFRLDMILLVGFEIANIVLSLNFMRRPNE